MKREDIHDTVKARWGDSVLDDRRDGPDPFLTVRASHIEGIAYYLRDEPALRFDLLSAIAGVDYPDRSAIEVVYLLDSTVHRHRLILKASVPREDARISSVERVWRTADWHERETFDLLGVTFEGHHNMVRILCAEDWEGHPLRKDYVMPETVRGIRNVVY